MASLNTYTLSDFQQCDVELLNNGGYAPLSSFMSEADYNSVLSASRLSSGEIFPLPVVLDISRKVAEKLAIGDTIQLRAKVGPIVGELRIASMWTPNKLLEAELVYGTNSEEHPGVAYLLQRKGEVYVSGELKHCGEVPHFDFVSLRQSPQDLRNLFRELQWSKVIAFQTRNPIHRAHFELITRAANKVNGKILLHPVVGPTKPGDVDYITRVKGYKEILPHFGDRNAVLSLLPYAMRMAGPREAVMHALIRKNYGATHFIVGRDHAGPGSDSKGIPFYPPFGAQDLLTKYAHELGIEPVFMEEIVYSETRKKFISLGEASKEERIAKISGTELRKKLEAGETLPEWFTFPEVAKELQRAYPPLTKRGLVLFFTGLPSAGKSTLAQALATTLQESEERKISILDGDEIRTFLSSELGFSKEHRDINVRRVGYVASEIAHAGGIAICALIAPFDAVRKEVRRIVESRGGTFILVHVSTLLSICEARDVKGLYRKARAGEIASFTGISDPYEVPEDAEVVVDTATGSIKDAVGKIVKILFPSLEVPPYNANPSPR